MEYAGRWYRRGRYIFLIQGITTVGYNIIKVDEKHMFTTTITPTSFRYDLEDGLIKEITIDEALTTIKELCERMKE